jgi:hypothetical protein
LLQAICDTLISQVLAVLAPVNAKDKVTVSVAALPMST